ncbi:MAG: outer membrane lipoprotein-sorting protein [Mariprofundaceae bacterium]
MKNVIGLILMMIFSPLAMADEASEIMNKAHLASYYAADDGKAHVKMEIINPDGGTRLREFTILRKDVEDGGDQWFYVYFKKPNDVREMTFLVKKHPHAADDRWLFIPSIRMVKRIAASDSRAAFVGSDYTYEDISGRHPSEDVAQLMGEEKVGECNAWVIRNTPKQSARDYSYRKTYVDQATHLVLKESYFDAKDKEVRRFVNDNIEKIDGFWVGTAGTMTNIETNHVTKVTFSKMKLNAGIPNKVFTERSLKSAPKKWIK